MDEFNTIVVQTRCTIILVDGDSASFTIDESSEKADWVNVSVVNGELVVYTKPEHYGYLLLHNCFPQITITYKTLTGLSMLDRCFIRSLQTLRLHQLGILVREGNLEISVDAFSIDCTVLKTAHAKISGETIISRVLTHQRGVYDGADLEASEGTVYAHSESKVSTWFTTEIAIGLFGRSKVNYRGSPHMIICNLDEQCTIKQISPNQSPSIYESY